MEQFFDFFLLRDPLVVWVVVGIVAICAAAALVGTFTFLRKQALVGDAISHAILPGICLAFMLGQTKHPLVLLLGAGISGWVGLLTINYLSNSTKLKSDTALSLVLSVFYGIGILLLTAIQNSGNAAQAGLDKYLFGKAAALLKGDVLTFVIFGLVLIAIVLALYQPFRMIIFDRDYAQARGIPVRSLELLLSVLTVSAIALGIQAVGVVLMAALLIAPAAAARYWTDRLGLMLILASVFAVVAGLFGAYVSYSTPNMPTGPWIVSFLSLFALGSVIFGSKRGLWRRRQRQQQHRRKMLHENILKCLWHLGEQAHDFAQSWTPQQMQDRRFLPAKDLQAGLNQLTKQGMVEQASSNGYVLTEAGRLEGERIIRIHRLWELYLTTHLNLPPDHVHEDAEAIEHIITPEVERELEKQLAFAEADPHASKIPYRLFERETENKASNPKGNL